MLHPRRRNHQEGGAGSTVLHRPLLTQQLLRPPPTLEHLPPRLIRQPLRMLQIPECRRSMLIRQRLPLGILEHFRRNRKVL